MAVDPTYPFYPIACIVVAVLLLLLLTTSFLRHSWNLGVVFLAFWLFWENLTGGINAVIWADNVDFKHLVYCDIVSRLDIFVSIERATCTFIITRRLHKTAKRLSIEAASRAEKRFDAAVEWGLGLLLPLLVAGPFYYIVQAARFQIIEGIGCVDSSFASGLEIILIESWTIVFPLFSAVFYCPMIIWTFYHHNKELNRFLHSNSTVSRNRYFRVLALACVDILLTLPFSVIGLILDLLESKEDSGSQLPFYQGWADTHSWAMFAATYKDLESSGVWGLVNFYIANWTPVLLGLVIFLLFGLTEDARAVYGRGVYTVGKTIGCVPRHDHEIPPMTFGSQERPMSTFTLDFESRTCPSESIVANAAPESECRWSREGLEGTLHDVKIP